MDNPWDELQAALSQHRSLRAALRQQAATMATMLVGNLRHVGTDTLCELKKEIAKFNMHTGKWRS